MTNPDFRNPGLKDSHNGTHEVALDRTLKVTLARTPKVCRIIAVYRYWASILPTFGGLGETLRVSPSGTFRVAAKSTCSKVEVSRIAWAIAVHPAESCTVLWVQGFRKD